MDEGLDHGNYGTRVTVTRGMRDHEVGGLTYGGVGVIYLWSLLVLPTRRCVGCSSYIHHTKCVGKPSNAHTCGTIGVLIFITSFVLCTVIIKDK